MRIRTKNPGEDHCIASGCTDRGDFVLGPDTFLGRKHQIQDVFGICNLHWTRHCDEHDKLMQKEALAQNLGLDEFQIPPKRQRTPTRQRPKRVPTARRE